MCYNTVYYSIYYIYIYVIIWYFNSFRDALKRTSPINNLVFKIHPYYYYSYIFIYILFLFSHK